jgi:mannose/cellobiose epimerase-like protein (N-acyl-D-glucosamine 2-epimerase family)
LLRVVDAELRAEDDDEAWLAQLGSVRGSVAAIASGCVDAMVERFFDAEHDLMVEVLEHSWERPLITNENRHFYCLGHAIEACWFLMDEALRQAEVHTFHTPTECGRTARDRIQVNILFRQGAERLRRHCEVAWDPLFGGLNRAITLSSASGEEKTSDEKIGWVQQEGLVGAFFIIEHGETFGVRGETIDWAFRFFKQHWLWVRETMLLKPHGYALWKVAGNRKAAFQERDSYGDAGLTCRKENYHHPRCLILLLEAAERLRARVVTTTAAAAKAERK